MQRHSFQPYLELWILLFFTTDTFKPFRALAFCLVWYYQMSDRYMRPMTELLCRNDMAF